MKFKDTENNTTLETENKFVIEQYQKYPERYDEIKDMEQKKMSKQTESK